MSVERNAGILALQIQWKVLRVLLAGSRRDEE
jgi:hypothetical protein